MPIQIENISLTYNAGTSLEKKALKEIDLSIADGEFIGIMGHTGCGKSTLLQVMAGLLVPSAGHVYLDGADINDADYDRSILRRKLGLVFQYPEVQLFETTVAKDVAFGLKHLSLSKEESEARVRDALTTMGFDYEKVRDQSPLSFSGGEKRRIAIAGVLAVEPKILLLDEPIAGLDPLARGEFLTLLRDLNAKGTTIIMISHNADSIAVAADRLIVFDDGRVVADDIVATVFQDKKKLDAIGLGVSQTRALIADLRREGFPLAETICVPDELVTALTSLLKEENAP